MIVVTAIFQFPDHLYDIPDEIDRDDPEAVIEWYEQFGDLDAYETSRSYS